MLICVVALVFCIKQGLCSVALLPAKPVKPFCHRSRVWDHHFGHKLKHRKFHLDIRKNVFTLRVTEHWNRLRREAVESLSLEISKPAWMRSCAVCCRWTYFGSGFGLDDPQRSVPAPTILWYYSLPASYKADTEIRKQASVWKCDAINQLTKIPFGFSRKLNRSVFLIYLKQPYKYIDKVNYLPYESPYKQVTVSR